MGNAFLQALLNHYQITLKDLEERNLPRSFVDLKRPSDSIQFNAVIERLRKAVQNKEKTVIYGDYDVDGLTSTAILKIALDRLGLNPGFFIPSRYVEGYGLNAERVSQFAMKGYHLIITVDNGISALESIRKAKEFGMEVIVIDHHEAPEVLPDTPYIFHQILSHFIDYNCSAASLAYFVARELLGKDDSYFAVLAGIAVFSDVMPLVKNNLVFAKIMMKELQSGKYANLSYILGNGNITYDSIGFVLNPALNSLGRIRKDSLSTNNGCRFLINKDDKLSIQKYGDDILRCSEERKQIVRNVTFVSDMELSTTHAKCVVTDSYSGLSGLFANRLMREENRPIAVFCYDEKDKDLMVASLRVPEGYAVDKFVHSNMERFVAGGGHERASGITIHAKDYFLIATLFCSEMEKQSLDLRSKEDDSVEIVLEDLNQENYSLFESFFPFGEGFPSPTFRVTVSKEQVTWSKSRKAVFVTNGCSGKISCFSSLDLFDQERYQSFTFTGRFVKEEFRSVITYTLMADKVIGNL